MTSTTTAPSAMRVASAGHAFFAATIAAVGIYGLVRGDLVAMWSGVAPGFPGRVGLAYGCGLVALLCGVGLLWRRTAALAARVLLGALVLWLLAFRVPLVVRAPTSSGVWWSVGDTAVMTAAAWVLCTWFADGARSAVAGDTGLRIARALYGFGLIPFGVAHFTFLERAVSLVPAWLPWHLAIAILTGCAFIAAGLAVITGFYAPLAARLSVIQMGAFTLVVWVPIITGRPSPTDWTEFVGSWVLTVAGWVVADSYRPAPSLAVDRELAPIAA